jgi:hypothetical protein
MYVLFGIFFRNNPVLSTLKICCVEQPPSSIIFLNTQGYISAAFASAPAASKWQHVFSFHCVHLCTRLLCVSVRNASRKFCVPYGSICIRLNVHNSSLAWLGVSVEEL